MAMFNYGMLWFGSCMDPRKIIALRWVVLLLSYYVHLSNNFCKIRIIFFFSIPEIIFLKFHYITQNFALF